MTTKLLVFSAGWCGPCKLYHPVAEEFAKANPDIVVDFVDVDDPEREDDVLSFGIMSIPFTVLLEETKDENGDTVETVKKTAKGALTAEKLSAFVKGN